MRQFILFSLFVVVFSVGCTIPTGDSESFGTFQDPSQNGTSGIGESSPSRIQIPDETNVLRLSDTNISGQYTQDVVLSGTITVTGDVWMTQDLTILPGTKIKILVQDDQNSGEGQEGNDGWDDDDPTLTEEYRKSHISFNIFGRLNASGTPEQRIIMTSASENPDYADWSGIGVHFDGSIIQYCDIDWAVYGINFGMEPQPNTIIMNNRINHSFICGVCTAWSNPQIYNNEIQHSGHELIDVHGEGTIIENNLLYDGHTGIVVAEGSATIRNNTMLNVGGGIFSLPGAETTEENNYVELAPMNSTLEWRYANFAYLMRGNPIIYTD